MTDWPGDIAPLPHQVREDRLGARLAGMVAASGRGRFGPLQRCRRCGNVPGSVTWVAAFWDPGCA